MDDSSPAFSRVSSPARDPAGVPRVTRLADIADIEAIEQRPYEEFMPWHSVPEALDAAAAAFAERPAITYVRSADPTQPMQVWSHAELAALRRQTADLLRELGVDDEHAIGFLLPAIPEAYLALFGGEAAGLVCPINYLLNAEHIAQLLSAVNACVLIALAPCPELDLGRKVADVQAACPSLRHVLWVHAHDVDAPDGFLQRVAAQPDNAASRSTMPTRTRDSLAACFHTGGTTGAPKLAQHTHGNQLHAAWSAAHFYASTERDVVINGFPLFHVAGSFVYGLSTLMSGGNVVLPTLLGLRNTDFVARYWDFARRLGATLLAGVPTVMSSLLGVPRGAAPLDSVRALFTGGSPLPNGLALQFEERTGIAVRNILGMTECAGVVSIEPFLGPRTPGSCGLRLPFTEVVAIDPDSGVMTPLPSGETGVLALRGPNVSPGYSDARYGAGTFEPGGWLVTGDLGHVDAAGRIFVTGRSKDVIIRSSHNIDPGMIEEALLRHPDVAHAAAVGELDDYAGELPVAFVALRPGSMLDMDALLAFAIPHIAERPAWPKRITLVDAMPMTAIGKVYKPALRVISTRRVIEDRLSAAQLDRVVEADITESPRGPRVRFRPPAGQPLIDGATRARLAELMARLHVTYEMAAPD